MFKHALIFGSAFVLTAGFASSQAFSADADGSQRYAFLVGVNDYGVYEDDSLANLNFCVADMKSLQEKLEQIGFKRVYCLTTDSTTSWQPTKARIEQKLEALLAEQDIGPRDLVLVALSGHGLEKKTIGGRSTAYFCPADAHSQRVETLVPVNWIFQKLQQSKAGMKLLLVDACRNLAQPRASGLRQQLPADARGFIKSLADSEYPRGIAAFLSCQSGQFSHEVPQLGHGVFMHFILEGLSGKADSVAGDRDGLVSLGELFNYASDQTEEYVNTKSPVKFSEQTPILRGDLPNYKLFRYRHSPGPAVPAALRLSFTVHSDTSGGGEPLEGARVSLMYRQNKRSPEAAVGSGTTRQDGNCSIQLPGYWMAVKGEFVALVRHQEITRRIPLGGITDGGSWRIVVPVLPQELTNSIGMKLRLIPPGDFLMGTSGTKPRKYPIHGEGQHRVRITRPFYLGMYEVTVGQFRAYAEAAGYKSEAERDGKGGLGYDVTADTSLYRFRQAFSQKPEYTWRNPGFSQTDEHPVCNVSWNDAAAFCRWMSKLDGREYRLPTEAEWEYACRAGTTADYYNGDDPEVLAQVGNVLDASAKHITSKGIASDDGYVFTAPVGRFTPNIFGLSDMHGNVAEWCADWYGSSYYYDSLVSDPTGPNSGSYRVIRGGGWNDVASFCRSAVRMKNSPEFGACGLGFRVALVPAE